jgi:ComF family protein
VLDLVYPPRCALCGTAIAEQTGLCADCWGELELPGHPSCATCQLPMDVKRFAQNPLCGVCQSDVPNHRGILAATLYNDASRKLVLNFKHGRRIALARLLGRLMARQLPPIAAAGDEPPLLVPVPLHYWRLWSRGFNQAALLAREIAQLGKGELAVDALVRKKQTPSLGGLGRADRERVLTGAIAVRKSRLGLINGRHVILIDDVLTSGATSRACVEALLDAAAASVRIACFARVVPGSGEGAERTIRDAENTTPGAIKTPGAT